MNAVLVRALYGIVNIPWRLREKLYITRLQRQCSAGVGSELTSNAVIHNARGPDAVRIGAETLFMGEIVVIREGSVRIGDWCYVGPEAKIWSLQSIEIGDRVFVSHGVHIFDNNSHSLSADERHSRFQEMRKYGRHLTPEPVVAAPVRIEDDVWIGFNAAVLKGVTVGKGAVVGACAVITQDVAPYAVMVGNPARQVGQSKP